MAADLAYAIVQTIHNFGAVAVVGSPAAAWLWLREQRAPPNVLVWLTLSGWMIQALSGSGFAVTSYISRGELPEVAGVAFIALCGKVACAIAGVVIAVLYLLPHESRQQRMQAWIWPSLFGAGAAALAGAAFLRWFG